MTDLKEHIRGLCLDNTHVLLVSDPEIAKQLQGMHIPEVERAIHIIVCDDIHDIVALDEECLNKAGWFKRH